MKRTTKQRLATLGLTLGIASPIKPDPEMPQIPVPEITAQPAPKKIDEEPTIITIYIYKNKDGEIQSENKKPDQEMIDEIEKFLKLTEGEKKKLSQLIKDKEFEEAIKYLKDLLKKDNITIKIKYIDPKEPAKASSEKDLGGITLGSFGTSNGKNVLFGVGGYSIFSGYSTPEPKLEDSARKWIETIEKARLEKKKEDLYRNID